MIDLDYPNWDVGLEEDLQKKIDDYLNEETNNSYISSTINSSRMWRN